MSESHMSTLAEWAVKTLGQAVLAAAVVAVGFGILASVSGEPGMLALGGVLAPFALAAVLVRAEAPRPEESGGASEPDRS